MNSLTKTAFGLTSSLFLAVGFSRLAEMFDPLHRQAGNSVSAVSPAENSETCVFPCAFTPRVAG